MQRWKQYGGLAGLLAVCLAAGLYGFTSTGGALPYAKRFGQALQKGAQEGGGPLVDLGRGVVIAGPITKGGLVTEYVAIVVVLVAVGVGLYFYAVRYRSGSDDGQDRDDGQDAA
ncbi:cobalamin transport operon protein [Halococcus sp. IIIV-5B]|uniref:cobalamin transport operon protein n=1 Tax=Halococcus sp. IIIV-5B TaxID=2321230 RepID=UPI000E75D5AB|nr:cobalamin transport operon protein [Halococcus sp. IIIV-5B]RJT05269.1 cobalamin transport operon protein [Halococcus sp. IIIV-5B]